MKQVPSTSTGEARCWAGAGGGDTLDSKSLISSLARSAQPAAMVIGLMVSEAMLPSVASICQSW